MVLFRAKTIVRGSRSVELAHLKKKEEERRMKTDFGSLVTFWFSTFVMLFRATRSLAGHENTQRGTVHCYKGLVYCLRETIGLYCHTKLLRLRAIHAYGVLCI